MYTISGFSFHASQVKTTLLNLTKLSNKMQKQKLFKHKVSLKSKRLHCVISHNSDATISKWLISESREVFIWSFQTSKMELQSTHYSPTGFLRLTLIISKQYSSKKYHDFNINLYIKTNKLIIAKNRHNFSKTVHYFKLFIFGSSP